MDRPTRETLSTLNQRFYSREARHFDATRKRGWRGWTRVLDAVEPPAGAPLRILDVGCGNGRFAECAEALLDLPVHYCGVDASEELLASARRRLGARPGVELLRHELAEGALEDALPPGPFDLVVAFGLFHHLPGFALRREVLEASLRRLSPGGHLAVALWRFGELPRFLRRVLPWSKSGLALDTAQLEPGDHLLRWGDGDEVRYCHHSDAAEIRALLRGLPADVIDRFDADGEGDAQNHYLVLAPRGA